MAGESYPLDSADLDFKNIQLRQQQGASTLVQRFVYCTEATTGCGTVVSCSAGALSTRWEHASASCPTMWQTSLYRSRRSRSLAVTGEELSDSASVTNHGHSAALAGSLGFQDSPAGSRLALSSSVSECLPIKPGLGSGADMTWPTSRWRSSRTLSHAWTTRMSPAWGTHAASSGPWLRTPHLACCFPSSPTRRAFL